uniref:Uncharacterized protein n=1 Tax=Meleagris gallopavo TaxID=9103 RepID=A0A803XM54_MELGA
MTCTTCMWKACQKEFPSGVPRGLGFHAWKELSAGATKSNLLLRILQLLFCCCLDCTVFTV